MQCLSDILKNRSVRRKINLSIYFIHDIFFNQKKRGKFKYVCKWSNEWKISKIQYFWKCKKILAWLTDCGRLPTNMRMKFHVKIILAAKKSAFACSAFSKKYNFSHNKSLFPQPKYSVELMAATTISEETCCTTCSTKGTKQKRLCRIILHSKMLIMPFQHLPSVHLLDWYGK